MLRVVELFAGIGSQTKALKNIGVRHEVVAISEWSMNSVISYSNLHCGSVPVWEGELTKPELLERLSKFTYSRDTKNPVDLNKLPVKKLNELWVAHQKSNNLGSIVDIKGEDFPDHDLLTYSFPCQDLSTQGLMRGLMEGKTSSLLWEVKRILGELGDRIPKVLLMENVPAILAPANKDGFDSWCSYLEELGYTNYIMKLNATDYGLPQNRLRCFMVSSQVPMEGLIEAIVSRGKRTDRNITHILDEEVPSKYYKPQLEQYFTEETPFRRTKAGLNYADLAGYTSFKSEAKLHNIDGFSSTVTAISANSRMKILVGDKIRIFTPSECWKLQGFTQGDFEKVRELHGDAELIKQAGNSIAVPVLEVIFDEITKRLDTDQYVITKEMMVSNINSEIEYLWNCIKDLEQRKHILDNVSIDVESHLCPGERFLFVSKFNESDGYQIVFTTNHLFTKVVNQVPENPILCSLS